jgi:hypothetical protein
MDRQKLLNFEMTHPGESLSVEEVLPSEASAVRARLLQKLGLPLQSSGLALVKAIEAKSRPLKGLDASSSGFNLGHLLAELQDEAASLEVFLNWYRFDELDRVRVSTLAAFFTDIWYPSADDLDIVDPRLRWVVSVAHHGGLRLLSLA